MNFLRSSFLLLFLFFASGAFAQSQRVEGTVSGTGEGPLEMANVIMLSAEDSSMIAYAFTNAEGRFRLSLEGGRDYILQVTYLGYRPAGKRISVAPEEPTILEPIVLALEDASLDEVEVVEEMPIVISGDTISYKTDAFTTGQERKLEDVLEQLPGFEVDDDGQVKVQGREVEKVMVDGKDFFEGDTKLATKNIPANAVDKVQVLRNYNDVSPLGQVVNSEDRIALNIKLKEGKKNMFFGDVSAEAGPKGRYYIHPNLFYYSPKASINFIGDVNNVGKPAFTTQDYFRFNGGFRSLAARSGSSFQLGNDLGISFGQGNRATENVSEFGAVNLSYTPSQAWTLSGFIIGSRSDVSSRSTMLRNYVGLDTMQFTERLTTDGINQDRGLMGKFSAKYAPNKRLQISYDIIGKISNNNKRQDRLSRFGMVENNMITTTWQEPQSLSQNLGLYYDYGAHGLFSLEIQHLYEEKDPFFQLQSDIRPMFQIIPLLNDSTYTLQQQRLLTTNKLDGALNYYYILDGQNHLDFSVGGTYRNQSLHSQLFQLHEDATIDFEDEALRNDVDFGLKDVFAGFHYKSKIEKLEIRPGVNLHYYRTVDEQRQDVLVRDWFFVLPDFFAKYNFKKSESLSLNYNMQAQFTDVNNIAPGAVLTGYNSLFMGNRWLDNALFHSINLRYFSVNMFSFTNIFAGISYNRKIDDITNTVTYSGLDRINTPINSPAANDMLTGYGRYEKRFWKLKGTLGANLSYTSVNSLVNGNENTNRSFTQSYEGELETNFKDWPVFTLGYKVSVNDYYGSQVENTFVRSRPKAEVEWVFLKGFSFLADYEYNFYRAKNADTSSEYDFLNATLYYQKRGSPWEFKAGVQNLLNTEIIREDSFSDFLVITSRVYVLPRYWLLGVKYDL